MTLLVTASRHVSHLRFLQVVDEHSFHSKIAASSFHGFSGEFLSLLFEQKSLSLCNHLTYRHNEYCRCLPFISKIRRVPFVGRTIGPLDPVRPYPSQVSMVADLSHYPQPVSRIVARFAMAFRRASSRLVPVGRAVTGSFPRAETEQSPRLGDHNAMSSLGDASIQDVCFADDVPGILAMFVRGFSSLRQNTRYSTITSTPPSRHSRAAVVA